MKLYMMLEQILRMVDYSLHCIAKLFKPPKSDDALDDEQKQPDDVERDEASYRAVGGAGEKLSDDFWATFDLKQDQYCPKLDLNLSCPLIVVPNLVDTTERFELDFGQI